MKSFNFIIASVCATLCALSCGIRLWLIYGLLALPCYAAVILSLPFSSAMHELGHMLFGFAVKIKAVPHFSVLGSSSCKIIPGTQYGLRGRLIFTTLGGLFVNTAIIAVGTVALFGVIPVWLCVFMPSSVYLLLLNGISAELPSGKTDGMVLSSLITDSDEARVMLAVLAIQAQILSGTPIDELDENLLFAVPVIREDDPAFISLTQRRYEYFNAKGDEKRALEYKTRLEELKEYI